MKTVIKKVTKNQDTKRPGNKDKLVIDVTTGSIVNAINNVVKKRQQIEDILASMTDDESIIKDYCRREYFKQFTDSGQQPDSFTLQTTKSAMMFIVQNSYNAKLTPESINDLKKIFGDKSIQVNTNYSMDAVFMKKYIKELKALIAKSKVIKDEHKPLLIKVTKKSELAKDVLETLPVVSKKTKKPMATLYTLLEPKEQLKTVEVKK